MQTKTGKPQRKCIFDFGDEPVGTHNGLSKEHAFADWISFLVPKTAQWHENLFTSHIEIGDGLSLRDARAVERQGDFLSRKLPIVCEKCNNGWMSVLQTRTKKVLAPLIQGKQSLLSVEQQETLAAWLTMTAIVCEYLNPHSMAISENERKEFYRTKRALPRWDYFIARHNGKQWRKHCYHHGALLMYTSPLGDKIPIELDSAATNNTQVTAFGIGHFWGTTARFPVNVTFRIPVSISRRIIRILPSRVTPATFGSGTALQDAEVDRLVNCFVNPILPVLISQFPLP